jgi:hypothetical protein
VILILLQFFNFNGCKNVNTITSKIKIKNYDIEILRVSTSQTLSLFPNSHEFKSFQDY